MTTLENLYNGNIRPCELEKLAEREDYKAALKQVCDIRDEFEANLSELQKYLFDKYVKESDVLSLIVEEEIFKEGFSLAMRIKDEVKDAKEVALYKDFEDMPPELTIPEVAKLLRVSPNHLYYMVEKDKTFPVLRLGRKKLIPKDELKEWIKKNCRK